MDQIFQSNDPTKPDQTFYILSAISFILSIFTIIMGFYLYQQNASKVRILKSSL